MKNLLTAATASITLAVAFTACDNPVESISTHIDAVEMVLRDSTGNLISATENNVRWKEGSLTSQVGQSPTVRISLVDIRGSEFTLAAHDKHSIRVESEPANLVTWEPFGSYGKLVGLAAGTGRVRFLIWHITHPDFVTPWIPVHVAP